MKGWLVVMTSLLCSNQLSFVQSLITISDQLIPGLETACDLDLVAISLADGDGLFMCDEPSILLYGHQDIFAGLVGLKCVYRNCDHIGSAVVLQLYDSDLVGADVAAGVEDMYF